MICFSINLQRSSLSSLYLVLLLNMTTRSKARISLSEEAAWIINMIFNFELVQWEKIVFSSFILLAIVLFAFGVVYLLCDSQKKWGEKCFPLKMKVLDFEQQMGKERFELKNAQNIAYRRSVEQQLDLKRRYEMMRIEEEQYEAETRRKTMQKKLEILDNIASMLAMESSHKSQ